jgi:endoglucanase Acf2
MFKNTFIFKNVILLIFLSFSLAASAQITEVGAGSYTNTFPGVDEAGRNGYPSGSPQLSGNALGKPVPTNDWWSALIKNDHTNNLFNYPMALATVNNGLVVSYIVPTSTPNGSSQPMDDQLPIIVGVTGLNATKATVSDFSDWTLTMNWTNNSHVFEATSGIAMPFIYFTKAATDSAKIEITEGTVTIDEEMLIISDSHQGADFAIYAPSGSTWIQNGTSYTSALNDQNYWSMAFLPPSDAGIVATANEYKSYAYVFPSNTTTAWTYNESNSKLTTVFSVETNVKEGTDSTILQGLLPHQWDHLADDSAQPEGYSFSSIRGEVKTLEANTFTVENTFYGILPTLPYLDNYSEGFNPVELDNKILQIENDALAAWTDSYNEGQVMNRLIQTARIANEMGDEEAVNVIVATIKERLEDWLMAETGEVAFLFYYQSDWSALLGYPAGHGQDNNLNDHHFHWGYFIHAAAFMEQFEPGWADQWGGMINLLIRDAASDDRNDIQFPFLRNFSPFAGHSWANGFATFPFGNDQESSSESMQFASSLIHWGSITENDSIRDLGIYIYTTEQTATEEYWFDIHQRSFKPGYDYQLASRIWGNGYDNQTFWTSDIAAAYGIEMYPIHGGSLYLGHHQEYINSLWDEISINTGILNNEENPNLWHDTYWKYLAFTDPQAAIDLYDSNPDRSLKFGISDAQTYHWLHAMNALGTVNTNITADNPIAASFTLNDEVIYVAHNYLDIPVNVTFSDGFVLSVPAKKMITSKDIEANGILTSSFTQAYPGGSVTLNASTEGEGVTKVSFYDNNTLIGEDMLAPYEIVASDLTMGMHGMYAKVFIDDHFSTTNIVNVQVGEQQAFYGNSFEIPGIIDAGDYDKFEGGIGQHISYYDASVINEGDYRTNEYVDAITIPSEGNTVGWISAGEWLEYSIDVEDAGLYSLDIRYASGNDNGGGPIYFEIEGDTVSPEITLPSTGSWTTWGNHLTNEIELTQGEHILRLKVINGEFNLGRMEFSFSSALDYEPPLANAGENELVILPESSVSLNGSQSTVSEGSSISYLWEQVYGPSTIVFDDPSIATPEASNLIEGVYKCKLTVGDGSYTANDYMLILVSQDGSFAPNIQIISPSDGDSFMEGANISILATASDLDGSISLVEFYDGNILLGTDESEPYEFEWINPSLGSHEISAIATDDGGIQGNSQTVWISVDEVLSCSETSNQAQQGSFSIGYTATFETVGNNVTISFELLDTDQTGVIAYLWRENPFSEIQMDHVSGLLFSKTLSGQTPGETISYACKFAFAGGLAVTQYLSYEVGEDCGEFVNIETSTWEQALQIYPNPTQNWLTIYSPAAEINRVEIYSVLGKNVKTIEFTADKIYMGDLPNGMYTVKIYTKKGYVTQALIKS